jgi:D-3-phosphoglycerate dehydrogenase
MMASDTFRVALSGDFRKPDGSPTYPDFDLESLRNAPGVEMEFLQSNNPLKAKQLADFDALILLIHRFAPESVPKNGRLSVVARFGVGYDTVDVDACTKAGIALVITPDGVRRPVAISVITFMLALTGKLMIKDRLTRQGAEGFAKRSEHMGVGLVGRTLGSLGIGNIGAEVFRMARPFDMKFIAHDPFANEAVAKELGIELVSLEDLFMRSDVLSVSCPLTPETRHIVNKDVLEALGPDGIVINVGRGTVIDERALIKALQDRKILSAGLDVFEDEPRVPAELIAMDHVVLLPHVGSASVHTRNAMGQLVVDNLVSWFGGQGAVTPVPECQALAAAKAPKG